MKKGLQTPFQLGGLTLPSNLFCAPLAGCSDFPFRQMVLPYQPGLIYCEMVKMEALVRHDANTFHLLDYSTDMHPIGAQICGSDPTIAATCSRMIEDMGFDVIDLNCGCPVDKVTKDGSGSAMLRTPDLIGEVLSEMVDAVSIPVTVKVRSGWKEGEINAPDIVKIAEQAGAKAICVHGRTREQGYKGPANWDVIRSCVQKANRIKVIGNGDIFDAESAEKIFAHTGCDAILVSRGTFGQPWIFGAIYDRLSGKEEEKKSGLELKKILLQHFHYITLYRPEKRALLDMRRVGCWYLKKTRGTKSFREALNKTKDLQLIEQLIEEYPWEEVIV